MIPFGDGSTEELVSFLAPLFGILAGATAGPCVLFLYFLKLKRRPVRVSAVRFWHEAAQDLQVNAPFRWIRASWLLMLHLLVLALLCVAAARPVAAGSGFVGGRVVVFIDHSASMSAMDVPTPGLVRESGGGALTRLAQAKNAAREAIGQAVDGGSECMVVRFASSATTVASFTRDRARLEHAVDAVEPTDQAGSLTPVLELAAAVGGERASDSGPSGEERPVRFVVLSDGGGRVGSVSPVSAPPGELRFVRCGPPPGSEGENYGIVALDAHRDYQDPGTVRVFVRVQGTGRQEAVVPLVCLLDENVVGTAFVRLAPASAEAPADVGQSFDIQTNRGGVISVRIGRRDTLECDNAAWLTLQPLRAMTIWLVSGQSVDSAGSRALGAAMDTLELGSVERLSESEYRARSSAMSGVDLVVLDGVRPDRLPSGVATLSFGAGLPIEGLSIQSLADRRAGESFVLWERSHPVMRYASLGDVRFGQPARVVMGEDMAARSGGAVPLAWTRAGAAIVAMEAARARRIVVAPSLGDSNWTRDISFPLFLANAVDYLTLRPESRAGQWFSTSEAVMLDAGVVGTVPGVGGPIRWEGPGGLVGESVVDGDGRAVLGVLPHAGVYTLSSSVGGVRIAVNLLDAGESAARTGDELEVAGRRVERETGSALSSGREVWGWFVLGALVLLCAEWFLFAWRSRV